MCRLKPWLNKDFFTEYNISVNEEDSNKSRYEKANDILLLFDPLELFDVLDDAIDWRELEISFDSFSNKLTLKYVSYFMWSNLKILYRKLNLTMQSSLQFIIYQLMLIN